MRATRALVAVAAGLLAACANGGRPARAPDGARDASITLVESAPLETTLDHADVPNAEDVWTTMIDRAQRSLEIAEFYVSDRDDATRSPSALTKILAAIARAIHRGVKVRVIVDAVFAPKYPASVEALRAAGAETRIYDFAPRGGGVHHAKYFVVDAETTFIGSQNFDWRALSHIQEIGAKVDSPSIARAVLDIFETDWRAAADAATPRVTASSTPPRAKVQARTGETIAVVGSPSSWLPDPEAAELARIGALLDRARRRIDVQVLSYKTRERDGSPFATLDDALRRAAARGVDVRLMVASWSAKPGSDGRRALEALCAATPKVTVRVLTIPPWSGGEIPFARVAHAKYLVVDGIDAWVGSSNWEGDYFTKSRNVGLVVEGGAFAPRLDRIFEDGWSSAYAKPLAAFSDEAAAATSARPSSSDPGRP